MTVEVYRSEELAALGDAYLEPETGTTWVDNTNGEVSVSSIEPAVRKVARQIARWMTGDDPRSRGGGPTLINRQSYATPDTPYAVMHVAYQAAEHDDVIGGVLDVTEGLMFQGMQFETPDQEEGDVFNQLARDLNLDALARMWHREESIYSQVVVGYWWARREYKLRLKSEAGRQSKKTKAMWAPVALTFLDPRKVVPLQPGPFGQDRLAWQASQDEYTAYRLAWDTGAYGDALMREFFNGPANLSEAEKQYLRSIGVQPEYLIMLNPDTVRRFTRTKSHYERFPAFRMKRTFALLDLKQHLMEADRAVLVGAANYILLVRQGDKETPATQSEIDNLRDNFKVIAKVPVITGDHRLQIDIITPSSEHVLESTKYDVLDRRIISTTLGALTVASSGQRNESTLTIARGVGRLLESRRQMFRRFIEETICRAVVEHPLNAGVFKTEPNLAFIPRQIQLDNDDTFYATVLELRSRNEISRATTLETVGMDQAVEAMRLEIEHEEYDDTFQTHVPFDSPANGQPPQPGQPDSQQRETPVESGTRGGRPKKAVATPPPPRKA